MHKLPIEDKYYKVTLSDGSVAYTRTSIIVNALLYYRKQCLDIINDIEPNFRGAPKIIAVHSLEEVFEKINSIQTKGEKLAQAKRILSNIDDLIARFIKTNNPSHQENENQKI